MEHSEYSPSRLHRIMECPGSVRLIKANNISGTPSQYALQGTKLHEYTHKYLTGDHKYIQELDKDEKFLVEECVDYFENVIRSKHTHSIQAHYENTVSLKPWGIPEVWGTSDANIVDLTAMHIDVFDWKFGSGVQVFAKENPQQMAYAAGTIGWPTKFPIYDITIHIVQPPFEHYDTWDLTVDELYSWVHNDLAKAIHNSRLDPPIFNPGEEQCRFCEAAKAGKCDYRHAQAHKNAVEIFENAKLKATLTPQQIQEFLDLFPLVEQVAKGYMVYIQEELERGNKEFNHYKLVRGRSNRLWVNEAETIKWLSENTQIEDLFESELLSPSKVEKEDKSLKKNVNFQKLYEKPKGKLKLAKASDKRPAVEVGKTAVNVFKDVQFPDELE